MPIAAIRCGTNIEIGWQNVTSISVAISCVHEKPRHRNFLFRQKLRKKERKKPPDFSGGHAVWQI